MRLTGLRAAAFAASTIALAATQGAAVAQDDIQIGVPLMLSGPGAFAGEASKRTLDMLAEELNAKGGAGGRQVKLIYYDTEGKPDVAVRVINRLVKSDQVDAVIGPIASWEAVAVKQVLEQAGVPTLMLSATRTTVDPLSSCIFKLPVDDAIVVSRVFAHLKENNIAKVALISSQDGFGDGGQRELLAQAGNYGVEIVFDEKFSMEDTDLAPLLNKVKRTDAQALINWSSSRAPIIVTNTYRQVGLDIPLIHSQAAISPAVLNGAGENGEGMLAAGAKFEAAAELPDSDPQKAVIVSYRDTYTAAFGEAPNQFGAGAYDAFNILTAAIEKAGTEPEAVCDAIEQTRDHAGLGGVYNYSDTDHAGLAADSVVIYEVRSGRWQLLR